MRNFFYSKLISLGAFLLMLVLIAGCQTGEGDKITITTVSEEAKSHFIAGRDRFEKLEQRESLAYFENAIKKDNDFAMAYYYHALANPTNKGFFKDYNKAIALVDKVSEGEKLMILALKAGVDGDQQMQEEHLTKLIDLYPNDERAHVTAATFYFGQQNYQKAVDLLTTATEINPDHSAAYNMLGYSQRNLGEFDAAETSFRKYIELIPDNPNPYDSYAELLMKIGRYEESIEQYQKALEMDPTFFSSRMGISNNYIYMGEFDKAKDNCNSSYDLAKNDGEKRFALFTLAVANVYEGNTDAALENLNKQYKLAEAINDAGAMANDLAIMGNILFEAGMYDEAKEKYDESLSVTVGSDLTNEVKENAKRIKLYRDGRIMLMTGEIDEAKTIASEFSEKAKAANNTFQIWLSHDLHGMIALNDKEYKKAQDEFMKSNQQNPYTLYKLALAYAGDDNAEKAKELCDRAANFNALTSMNQAFVTKKAKDMLATL